MDLEETYRSFKLEMRELKDQWKLIMREPVEHVSSRLKEGWNKTLMGIVEES